jgi:nitrogen fixation-related uncharacterized protein
MRTLLNVVTVIVGALIVMKAFFWIVEQTQLNDSEATKIESLNKEAKIKDLVVNEQGYGVNVIAEVENLTSKEIKFCEVTFTWYNKEGKLIDSAVGMGKNIKPNSTGIVDRYFDGIPKGQGATCKATIGEVSF